MQLVLRIFARMLKTIFLGLILARLSFAQLVKTLFSSVGQTMWIWKTLQLPLTMSFPGQKLQLSTIMKPNSFISPFSFFIFYFFIFLFNRSCKQFIGSIVLDQHLSKFTSSKVSIHWPFLALT